MTATLPASTSTFGTSRDAPATLAEPAPRSLGLADQTGLWTNLGVSLLGFTGAIFVLQPFSDGRSLSLFAAILATVIGTTIGTLLLAGCAVVGARTGSPAMVGLRGLLGGRVSYLPTALNVLQCLGWGTFELVTIATAAERIAPGLPRWGWVLIAGALTTAMTIRPLGAIRVLRKYVTVFVVLVVVYLFVQLLRHPLPGFGDGTWSGFPLAVDNTVAAAVSFVPLAADYTRHARSGRTAFAGTFLGYSIAQIACYVLGLIALVTVAKTPDDIYGAFIAVPAGTLCFAILATRELDQSFANVYSTAVSLQNARPLWDRRVLGVLIGVGTTVLALWVHIGDYQNFLYLLGAVFVPLGGVLVVDFFVFSRGRWDLAAASPARWSNLTAWVLGFVAYQLINPGYIGWWQSAWQHVDSWLGLTPPTWASASLFSLAVAMVATAVFGALRRSPTPRSAVAAP